MTVFEADDLAVITGPLRIEGCGNTPDLYIGEVVTVLTPADGEGDVFVRGHESGLDEYISWVSLTPLVDIQDDDAVRWGDLLDPNYIHDYVWDGPYEEESE